MLSAWVDAAESLRTAIHVLESERGPLVESLFPEWRGPSLRRHADQARAAETELQRRLASGYVVRRLAELTTHAALGAALEGLAAAGTAWAAHRDRPSLEGAEADVVRTRLLALAGRTAHLLERVRWVVRAALADRPGLSDAVFPRRTRPASTREGSAPAIETEAGAPDAPATASATRPPRPARTTEKAESSPAEGSSGRRTGRPTRRSKAPDAATSRATEPSTRGSRSSDAPSSRTAGPSTRTPGSSASAAPAPQPSAPGSRRRPRTPRRK